ncbi:IS200/IS605 family accessory protein TnpB-related protein, partial [Streptomyces sp. NPDC046805]
HPIRRRTAPPRDDRSDRRGHRTAQTGPGTPGTRPRVPGPRTRSAGTGRGANAGDQRAQNRSGHTTEHES